MTHVQKALIWAAAIIIAAVLAQGNGLTGGASFGIIGGLSGAAWGSLNSDMGCKRRCLQ